MSITVTQLLIWIIIAAVVGVGGELLAGRRGPGGAPRTYREESLLLIALLRTRLPLIVPGSP